MKIQSIVLIFIAVLLTVGSLMWGLPTYKVWQKEKSGQAQLMEARQNRQIQIEEAQANLEAERLNAQAEVVRAKGMAEAMEIENGQLTPTYVQYLWVRSNKFNDHTTIYVPTESNLPLLEASRFQHE
jgi:regulator of protease activity HflC (stomatin/prohibitin superfamily)